MTISTEGELLLIGLEAMADLARVNTASTSSSGSESPYNHVREESICPELFRELPEEFVSNLQLNWQKRSDIKTPHQEVITLLEMITVALSEPSSAIQAEAGRMLLAIRQNLDTDQDLLRHVAPQLRHHARHIVDSVWESEGKSAYQQYKEFLVERRALEAQHPTQQIDEQRLKGLREAARCSLNFGPGQEFSLITPEILNACSWLPQHTSSFPAPLEAIIEGDRSGKFSVASNTVRLKSRALTLESPQWQEEIMTICEDYLRNEGSVIINTLQIRELRELNPYQAIMLSLNLTTRLLPFSNDGDRAKVADEKSIPTLLSETVSSLRDPEIAPGYAVCRHQASAVQLIFQALQSIQSDPLTLKGIVPLVQLDADDHPQAIDVGAPFNIGGTAHALNTFLIAHQGGCASLQFDVTNQQGFESIGGGSSRPIGLGRSELLFSHIASGFSKTPVEHREGLLQTEEYYQELFTSRIPQSAKAFYVSRYLQRILSDKITPSETTTQLVLDIIADSPRNFRIEDLEKLLIHTPASLMPNFDKALQTTIRGTSALLPKDLIVRSDVLQTKIIDMLQSSNRLSALTNQPEGMIRLWDCKGRQGEIFNPLEDGQHFNMLRALFYKLPLPLQNNRISAPSPNSESITKFFGDLRKILISQDPTYATQILRGLDDYTVLREFPTLLEDLNKRLAS